MFLFCHFSLCEIIGEDGGGEKGEGNMFCMN